MKTFYYVTRVVRDERSGTHTEYYAGNHQWCRQMSDSANNNRLTLRLYENAKLADFIADKWGGFCHAFHTLAE